MVVLAEDASHTVNDFGTGQHASLDTVGSYGTEEGFCLRDNKFCRQMVNTFYLVYILIYYTGKCSSGPTATACNGLDVGLYASAAQRLAASYKKYLSGIDEFTIHFI